MNAKRPPTSTDLEILQWLKEGNILTGIVALKLFKKTGFRDSIYRLRLAGHSINSKMIHRKSNGKHKCYVEYSVKKNAA